MALIYKVLFSSISTFETPPGDAWVWIAFAPVWRLVAAFVVGKRDQEHANVLLKRLHAVSCEYIPFFTSDQLPHLPRPCYMCMAGQRLSCTYRANVGPSPNPSSFHPRIRRSM